MSFISLLVRNLLRQPTRAGLTLLGISAGITTVVALGVIMGGMRSSMGDVLTVRGSDFMVAQEGTADLSFSTIPESEVARVAAVAGVESAAGALFHIARVGSNPFFVLVGADAAWLEASPPTLLAGRLFAPGARDELVLGDGAARDLHAGVGNRATLADGEFTVIGIYHAGTLWEDNGGYAPLATVQEIAAKPATVTVIYVRVTPGAIIKDVARAIEEASPGLTAITNVDEYGKVDQGLRIMDAANLAISILAVGIGAIGVMNTMIMSVFERTREIGILRAVGWNGSRVLRMVLGESLVLCVLAAVAGSLMGVGASRAVMLVPAVANVLEPRYEWQVFARALAVAVGVALAGAAYPAYRAVRLTPMAALRYE